VTGWTMPADVERRLHRRWDSGDLLREWGSGREWEPVGIGLRAPTAGDLANRLAEVRRWASLWERASGPHLRLERRRVGGRLVGVNELPARVWVDGYEQAWAILGMAVHAARFGLLLADARERIPRLVEWMLAHPLRLLDLEPRWPTLVATVLWIDAHAGGSSVLPAALPWPGGQGQPIYLRQVDVPGVDTKFIERHRGVLAELLDAQLAEERIDRTRPRSDFEARYGFRSRPAYIRLRSLDPGRPLAGGYTEMSLRREELAGAAPGHAGVYIVENEITYLAFPPVRDAVALFGGGYAVSATSALGWLAERQLTYSGDIDTHGFAILDRLRQRFPNTRSLLMDRATVLAHEDQWVTEPSPVAARLDHLEPEEADLYRDLVEDALGTAVRLEQERICYSAVERATRPARAPTRTPALEGRRETPAR
jgi:hypothetical protein